MHRKEFIALIEEATAKLGIQVHHFSDNWGIKLSTPKEIKYIIGCTFPLNNASAFKIVRNKNVCSEILTASNIPNVPHHLLFNPAILNKHSNDKGNAEAIQQIISRYSFPLVVKRNNSSYGEGVFKVHNRTELEEIIIKVFTTDKVLCICPFRNIVHEYRNIMLNDKCLLSYEKIKLYVIGDGDSTLFDLILKLYKENLSSFDIQNAIGHPLLYTLNDIPKHGEKINLSWKHNSSFGMTYELVEDEILKKMAKDAAKAINSNFVSVDIIQSKEFGLEVLEVNASVVLNAFSSSSVFHYQKALEVFELALKATFQI